MLRLITIFALCISCTLAAADSPAHENENGRFWVHGRLSAWNGTPTFRIWVIGTKRILGVTQNSESPNSDFPEMPKDLMDIFSAQVAIFGTDIYGDFLVEPLAPDKKGVMRPVRVITATKRVVIYDGKIVAAPKSIKTEPNQSLQTTIMAVTEAAAQPPRRP